MVVIQIHLLGRISSCLRTFVQVICPHWIALIHVLETSQLYMWEYFWTFSSIPLICMSVLMPVAYCLDYSNFIVNFEIEKCETSNFVLFQGCFSYFGSLHFQNLLGFWLGLSWICRSVLGKIGILLLKQ